MLDLFLGALMAGGTGVIGYVAGRSRRRADTAPEMPKAICPCNHAISFHDNMTGACNGSIQVEAERVSYDLPLNYRQEPCGCKHYAGPQLVDQITMRAITMDEG